jgi:acetoin utilization deacetylase AcuC-like enzyme
MHCFYSDTFVLPLPDGHRFPMAKYSSLRQRLLAERIVSPGDLSEAPRATWEDLRLVHTLEYTMAVERGTLSREAQRRIGFPWSPPMVERARRSVGATIAAAHRAVEDGCAANLAGGTHHAFADRGEGFCVFNDVAVATRVLARNKHVGRVAIVDCDVHQGNGTAAIFRSEPAVFTLSLHGAKNYPFKKERSTLDIELEDGTGDEPYLAQLAHSLAAVFDFRPDVVFYLAGADPYEGDRLGRLKLTIEGLRHRDALVLDRCQHANVPVVITMSGGYSPIVDDIVTIHANTIRTAIEAAANRHNGGTPGTLGTPGTPGIPGTVDPYAPTLPIAH